MANFTLAPKYQKTIQNAEDTDATKQIAFNKHGCCVYHPDIVLRQRHQRLGVIVQTWKVVREFCPNCEQERKLKLKREHEEHELRMKREHLALYREQRKLDPKIHHQHHRRQQEIQEPHHFHRRHQRSTRSSKRASGSLRIIIALAAVRRTHREQPVPSPRTMTVLWT